MRLRLFYFFLLAMALASCSGDKVKYRIGISQCSADIWRDKQNAELRMGAYFHDNVELKFAAAYDSDERQVEQIDSLVNDGIDLLVVAPNQVQTISPAIDRAYDKGIPVIVFERKTSSQKYTAFISADNYEMGRVMGEYIAARLHGQGTVLEIKGLEGSSPAIERHNGFMDALKGAPGIKVVGSLQGDWTEPTAYETTRQWLGNNKDVRVDLVFGANDRTAMGARRSLGGEAILYCGIDGLPGENGGIQLVRDSLLDASYIYPTHGDQIIDLAVRILEGKPYKKETLMMSALVTHDNAKVLLMQGEELMRQADRLDQLHHKADNYLHELDTQRIVNWLAIGIIALLIVVFVLFYLFHLRKVSMQRERVVNTLWNISLSPDPTHDGEGSIYSQGEETIDEEKANPQNNVCQLEESPQMISHKQAEEVTTPLPQREGQVGGPEGAGSSFLSRFREAVEARLNDSNLSVDDLAADMNLSRVQLYRKVKAVTGSSPVELLRTARLNRAYQLLLTTDKSVSEVAYGVGFTAPSYFTKCFKEEYGMVPGDVRKS
jgi:ABC-type sugar transport system substrate-binding protein/AraC-like DNA-binding protein